jgi:hypothetical protein
MSEDDKDLARELAIEAIISMKGKPLTVYVTLDIKIPETLEAFDRLAGLLLAAYKQGQQAAVK